MTALRPNIDTVRRILARVVPSHVNSKHPRWRTAQACVILNDEDPHLAVHRATHRLKQQGWDLLELQRTDTLIEDLVCADDPDIWQAYLEAAAGEIFLKIWPDPAPPIGPEGQLFLPQQISEPLFDEIVAAAGGKRVTEVLPDQDQLNADYIIDDTIFELKTLEENGLEKETRQEKLAELFGPYCPDEANVLIDPAILRPEDYRRYLDILGNTIQGHVKRASKQVKVTQAALGGAHPRGGVVLLNVGFPALSHDVFAEQVLRYVKKDTKHLDDVVAIAVWTITSQASPGWPTDSVVNFRFEPGQGGSQAVSKLRDAFYQRFEAMMTDLMRGQQSPDVRTMTPVSPTAFTRNGQIFRWEP